MKYKVFAYISVSEASGDEEVYYRKVMSDFDNVVVSGHNITWNGDIEAEIEAGSEKEAESMCRKAIENCSSVEVEWYINEQLI